MMVTVLFHLSHAFDFSEGQNEEAALREVLPYARNAWTAAPSSQSESCALAGPGWRVAGARFSDANAGTAPIQEAWAQGQG